MGDNSCNSNYMVSGSVDLLATHLQLAAILGTTHDIECRAQYTVVADTFKHLNTKQKTEHKVKQGAFFVPDIRNSLSRMLVAFFECFLGVVDRVGHSIFYLSSRARKTIIQR
jgi:hypothetical protein